MKELKLRYTKFPKAVFVSCKIFPKNFHSHFQRYSYQTSFAHAFIHLYLNAYKELWETKQRTRAHGHQKFLNKLSGKNDTKVMAK